MRSSPTRPRSAVFRPRPASLSPELFSRIHTNTKDRKCGFSRARAEAFARPLTGPSAPTFLKCQRHPTTFRPNCRKSCPSATCVPSRWCSRLHAAWDASARTFTVASDKVRVSRPKSAAIPPDQEQTCQLTAKNTAVAWNRSETNAHARPKCCQSLSGCMTQQSRETTFHLSKKHMANKRKDHGIQSRHLCPRR